MQRIKQASVKWHQFGHHHSEMLGERFEDAGERLAVVTCPWCGHRRSLEYFEYMQLLRMNEIACLGCDEYYSLRPISSLRQPRKESEETKEQSMRKEGVSKPEDKPDDFGRRDWGLA